MSPHHFHHLLLRLVLLRYPLRLLLRLLTPLGWLKKRFTDFWRAYWRRLSHFQQHFVSNLLVGTLIAALLVALHHKPWLADFENLAMDSMMQVNRALPRMTSADLHFAVLDVDEAAYQAWGEPFYTPRDKLLTLLRFAAHSQPRLIILDIDLSGAGHMPAADQALAEFLRAYDAKQPPLLLLRNFYPPGSARIRPLFFDATQAGTGIAWAQPLFQRDTHDHNLRRWFLSRLGCAADKPLLLPSFQLLADAWLHGDQLALQQALNAATPATCADSHPPDLHYRALDSHSHGIGERLIYSQPWPPQTQEVLKIPALTAEGCAAKPADCDAELLRGRIVVIGSSHQASHDLHHTPLGDMPGMMVIVNAIKSFHQFGQTSTPPSWVKWLLEAALILLMAWAFARFNSMSGALVSGGLIILVLAPVSFYLFKFGVWVDFAIPIIGMQLHQMVAQYEEEVHLRRHLQHALRHQHRAEPAPLQLELPLPAPPAPPQQDCLPLLPNPHEEKDHA